MMNSEQPMPQRTSLREVVDMLNAIIKYLRSKLTVLLIIGLCGAILGFAYGKYEAPAYTATLTFVLDESDGMGGAMGQYAGLASMVGIDLGGGGSGGIFKGENIMELYKSRSMIVKTLLSNFTPKTLFIERYLEFNQLKTLDFHIAPEKFTIQHDSILTSVVNTINKKMLKVAKLDKKLSIIKVELKSKDEVFAKRFTETLVGVVNGFYAETKMKKSTDNLKILQKQVDSVRRELKSAITGVAVSTDANPNINPARQVLRVPTQNKQVDIKANTAILEELVKNMEISKVSSRNNRPLIQIVDAPVLPLVKSYIGPVNGLLLGIFLSLFLTIAFFCAKFVFKLLLK